MHMSWRRFAAMILTSTAIMFVLMYQLVYAADHVLFSLNRLLASLAMGCIMAVVMLAFMWSMYKGMAMKVVVAAGGVVLALVLISANRRQAFVSDVSFMRAMIPHHSIAVNNASKARISDPRVRRLADHIIESQVREIEEMKLLIADIGLRGERGRSPLPARSAELTPELAAEAQAAIR